MHKPKKKNHLNESACPLDDSVTVFLRILEMILVKPLELVSESGRVAGCKINTWISVAFLQTNNERSGREIQETIPFTITSKRIKT